VRLAGADRRVAGVSVAADAGQGHADEPEPA